DLRGHARDQRWGGYVLQAQTIRAMSIDRYEQGLERRLRLRGRGGALSAWCHGRQQHWQDPGRECSRRRAPPAAAGSAPTFRAHCRSDVVSIYFVLIFIIFPFYTMGAIRA